MVVSPARPRRALVIGADRPFGAEIVTRLDRDGFTVERAMGGDAPLDLLLVNAPWDNAEVRFRDLTDDIFNAALETQLFEPAAAAQAAIPRLQPGASIVFVSSRAHLGGWGGAHRIAAGGALVGMSRSLALELGERGIRVNVLAPDFTGERWDTPAAREEIAGAVAWLAGPDSAAMSGETLLLDRGRTLRMGQAARR